MRAARGHEFIGLSPKASPTAIRKSYRNWRNVFQPLLEAESCLEHDPNKRWMRQQGMRRINEAYMSLLQPRRQRHKHRH